MCSSPWLRNQQPSALHSFWRQRDVLAHLPIPAQVQEPSRSPAPVLTVSALAVEEGNMLDFFAKHHLNFVTSKAAAALLGAVYIACGYCFLRRAAHHRLAAEAGSQKVFLCVSKTWGQAIASQSPYGSSKARTSGRPGQMFSQQPGQSCKTQDDFAGATGWLNPSCCMALCVQPRLRVKCSSLPRNTSQALLVARTQTGRLQHKDASKLYQV